MWTLPPILLDIISKNVVIDCKKFPPVNIIAPEKIPIIREKYTSFVHSAKIIVISGGSMDIALASIKISFLND